MGPNSFLALWESVKVKASIGNRGSFSFQFNTLPVSYSPGKSVFTSRLVYNRRHPILSPKQKYKSTPLE